MDWTLGPQPPSTSPRVYCERKMAQAGTARLLVMHHGQLVGLLTMNGVIRRLKVREELAG